MSEWTKGEFEVATYGDGVPVRTGLIREPFAIDERWPHDLVITHLPTGMRVPARALELLGYGDYIDSERRAKTIVVRLLELSDWKFTSVKGRKYKGIVKKILAMGDPTP